MVETKLDILFKSIVSRAPRRERAKFTGWTCISGPDVSLGKRLQASTTRGYSTTTTTRSKSTSGASSRTAFAGS